MSIFFSRPMITAAATLAFGLLGCKSKGGSPPIGEGLEALGDNQSLFSFTYVDDPPDGARFRIEIHEADVDGPCALHGLGADVNAAAPFWYLAVKTGGVAPGTFEIVPFFDDTGQSDKAGALLTYVKGREDVHRYEAVGGEVQILEAPKDTDEWHTGMELRAEVRVEFPKNAMRTEECGYSWSLVDGGLSHGTCACVDVDGKSSTCDLELTDAGMIPETCCLDLESPTVEFETSILASPCAEACLWLADVPHLAQYCQALM